MATKIGQRAQELARQNPWWRDPTAWTWHDIDMLGVQRNELNYRSGVLDELVEGGLYILRGPRRVGKTVAIKQCIEDLIERGTPETAIIRAAVDGWTAADLRTLTQNTAIPPAPPGVRRYWFLDEITAVAGDWARQIKWLRDNDPDFSQATVVLTGSNAEGLTDAVGVLAGRRGSATNVDRTLLPIGFRTFVGLVRPEDRNPSEPQLPLNGLRTSNAAVSYKRLSAWLDDLVRAWDRYLNYGGFPTAVAAARAGESVPLAFLDALFDVVAHDAFARSRLSHLDEIGLLERLWKSIGTPANLTSIAGDVGIRPESVARHIGYLQDAYLLWQCPKRDPKQWLPQPKSQPKLYSVDPLLARLPHLRSPERSDVDPTALTEMQIGMALRRRQVRDRPPSANDSNLFYMRTPSRKEIDFIARDLGDVAIEGKFIEDGRWKREAQTVEASEWNGILVTRNVLDVEGTGAWAVPAGILAFLLDT